jgi:hypothetical protein
VEASRGRDEGSAPAELETVGHAAGDRLRAETDEDFPAIAQASEALVSAATAAMGAGYSLSEIARAETRGKDEVRSGLSGDALRRVERTGRQARDAQLEHHRAIARAMRLGLSTREIAAAADVTHGTVRAITNRLAASGSQRDVVSEEGAEQPGQL